MAAHRGVGLMLLVAVTGLIVGSLLGELLASILPAWLGQDLLAKGPTIGLNPPSTLDLRFLALTFGFTIKVNLVGVVGIVIAALTLRRL